MPPIDPNDLSPEEFAVYEGLQPAQQPIYLDLHAQLRGLVGKAAPRNACPEDQPVCNPDTRVTSQLVAGEPPQEWMRPWRIRGARRGDLIMSPGGRSGMIGALLSRLDPPQVYSHVGIVVEDDGVDGTHIRHATAVQEWVQHESHYNGLDVLGIAMPSDGFSEDAMRYQWPGTITQTVEVAYKGAADKCWELEASGKPKRDARNRRIPLPEFGEHEPQTGEIFVVKAFSFSIVHIEGIGLVFPLVVKPCKETPAVRAALYRVARAAKAMRGHYRLFAYTDGAMLTTPPPGSLDPSTLMAENRLGPPQLESQRMACIDGWLKEVSVQKTMPLVCSTFVWHAVQEANKQNPKIILDGRANKRIVWADGKGKVEDMAPLGQVYDPANPLCPPRQIRQPHLDKVELGRTLDGLYAYGSSEREKAGDQLYQDVTKAVVESVDDALATHWVQLGGAGIYIGGSALVKLYNAIPLAQLPALLGISLATIKDIMKLLTDMPQDVAYQFCNSFASDWCATDAKDSDKWKKETGTGHTVSPDNIIRSWAAPTREDGEIIHGIYGTNVECIVLEPEPLVNKPDPSSWRISTGSKEVRVSVLRSTSEAGDQFANGATIAIGCCSAVLPEGTGTIKLPFGRYWMQAQWTDLVSNLKWESKGEAVDITSATVDAVARLHPPRETRRLFRVRSAPGAKLHLLNRHVSDEIPLFGTSAWEKDEEVFVDRVVAWNDLTLLDDWPDDTAREKAKSELVAIRHQKIPWAAAIEDWGYVELEFEVEADEQATLVLTLRARLREKKSGSVQDEADYFSKPWTASRLLVLPKDASKEAEIQLEVTGFAIPPVRASGRVRIDNLLAP